MYIVMSSGNGVQGNRVGENSIQRLSGAFVNGDLPEAWQQHPMRYSKVVVGD